MPLSKTRPAGNRNSKTTKGETPMRKFLVPLLIAAVLVVGWTMVPGPFAQEPQPPRRSMGHGMMGGRGMMGGMNMGQRSQMMGHCSQMMGRMGPHGSSRPNEQWRQQMTKTPERKS